MSPTYINHNNNKHRQCLVVIIIIVGILPKIGPRLVIYNLLCNDDKISLACTCKQIKNELLNGIGIDNKITPYILFRPSDNNSNDSRRGLRFHEQLIDNTLMAAKKGIFIHNHHRIKMEHVNKYGTDGDGGEYYHY